MIICRKKCIARTILKKKWDSVCFRFILARKINCTLNWFEFWLYLRKFGGITDCWNAFCWRFFAFIIVDVFYFGIPIEAKPFMWRATIKTSNVFARVNRFHMSKLNDFLSQIQLQHFRRLPIFCGSTTRIRGRKDSDRMKNASGISI